MEGVIFFEDTGNHIIISYFDWAFFNPFYNELVSKRSA